MCSRGYTLVFFCSCVFAFQKARMSAGGPSFGIGRTLGQLLFGHWFHYVTFYAFNYYLGDTLANLPAAVAVAVVTWLIANGGATRAPFARILAYSLASFGIGLVIMGSYNILAYTAARWALNSSLAWRTEPNPLRANPRRRRCCARVTIAVLMCWV
jgi:hypothetical protein